MLYDTAKREMKLYKKRKNAITLSVDFTPSEWASTEKSGSCIKIRIFRWERFLVSRPPNMNKARPPKMFITAPHHTKHALQNSASSNS